MELPLPLESAGSPKWASDFCVPPILSWAGWEFLLSFSWPWLPISYRVCLCEWWVEGSHWTMSSHMGLCVVSWGRGECAPWQPVGWTMRDLMLDSNHTYFSLPPGHPESIFHALSTNLYLLKLDGTLGWNSGPWNVGGSDWSFKDDPAAPSYRSLHDFSLPHLPTGF